MSTDGTGATVLCKASFVTETRSEAEARRLQSSLDRINAAEAQGRAISVVGLDPGRRQVETLVAIQATVTDGRLESPGFAVPASEEEARRVLELAPGGGSATAAAGKGFARNSWRPNNAGFVSSGAWSEMTRREKFRADGRAQSLNILGGDRERDRALHKFMSNFPASAAEALKTIGEKIELFRDWVLVRLDGATSRRRWRASISTQKARDVLVGEIARSSPTYQPLSKVRRVAAPVHGCVELTRSVSARCRRTRPAWRRGKGNPSPPERWRRCEWSPSGYADFPRRNLNSQTSRHRLPLWGQRHGHTPFALPRRSSG